MKSNIYRINSGFARNNNVPAVSITAIPVIETPKAIYLYGHAVKSPSGVCMKCGLELTHPGSVVLGIGPECLKNWGLREEILNTMDMDAFMKAAFKVRIDGWFPKTSVKFIQEGSEDIILPSDHPTQQKRPASVSKKSAELATNKTDSSPFIKIQFPYSVEDLERVKSIPGRRFHNEGSAKYWTAPFQADSVKLLEGWGFSISPELKDLALPKTYVSHHVDFIPGLKQNPFPYQMDGVRFLESRNGNGLIADEMGLGKTIQALAYLQLHPELRPAIIVVPASLKLNWLKEAKNWMDKPNCQVLSGTKANLPIIGDILIINYDILNAWLPTLKTIKPQVLVLDEVHYIKNSHTTRTKAVKVLKKICPHMIALSGTPIINRPVEAYNIIKLLDPTTLSFFSFAQRYCGAKHNGFGWDFNGASNTEELHKKLTDTIMIRRMKSEVLKDLPAKIRSFVPIEMKNASRYQKAEANFINWIRENKGIDAARKAGNAEALVEIETLKQVSVEEKMPGVIDWIQNFLESGEKLIMFANHKFVIDALMDAFPGVSVKIDGSVANADRQKAVDNFQNNPDIRLFIGNIKAAGVGITLTAASNVGFVELPWTPGELDQAEDRAHRIGQQNTVNIHYLLADGTIENEIAEMLDKKRKVLVQVLDGKAVDENSLFSELMKRYSD